MKKLLFVGVLSLLSFTYGQNLSNYSIVNLLPCTEVKNQGNSGTCWSFGTLSFIEAEILRTKNLKIDLSEMYIARNIYPEKVKNYLRTQGNSYFTAGGQPQDVLRVIRDKGLVPESAYPQKTYFYGYDTERIDTLVSQFVRGLRKTDEDLVPSSWINTFIPILDSAYGVPPERFSYKGKEYTPKTFCSNALEIDPNNYVQVTSFNHHPYHQFFCLESRFNWSYDSYYNVNLDEFMNLIKQSLSKGYSLVFNGDVSEDSFDFSNGLAKLSVHAQNDSQLRQELFESGATTVDHVMHIVGIANDKFGKTYFITKNSWGSKNACGGFIYLSEDFVKYKTVSILLHKDLLEK
ncbi:MAG: hypothetical protein EBV19_00975 [Flavobacteriia bacterium]|nr:hypothetical protein [Flavobacteriia bacterium]